jgi:hypothetical protein
MNRARPSAAAFSRSVSTSFSKSCTP